MTTRIKQIATQTRRHFILELRKSGATYRAIAEATIRHFGQIEIRKLGAAWREAYPGMSEAEAIEAAGRAALPNKFDHRYACLDVSRELQRLHQQNAELSEGVVDLEVERLDVMLLAIWQDVRSGDTQAINTALRIMERRARLMGLDAPTKDQHDFTIDGEIVVKWPEDV